jgi:hypothetical protein
MKIVKDDNEDRFYVFWQEDIEGPELEIAWRTRPMFLAMGEDSHMRTLEISFVFGIAEDRTELFEYIKAEAFDILAEHLDKEEWESAKRVVQFLSECHFATKVR